MWLLLFGTTGSATLISDFDLNQFDFEIESITGGTLQSNNVQEGATIAGTSGGIDWNIASTSTWLNRTKQDNSFQFSGLPITTDVFHPGDDFTIQFSQTIDKLIVALSNDNKSDSINFQLTPSDFTGMTFTGTQAVLNGPSGGIVLFENINSLTISHVNTNELDGFDVAFWVVSPSSVPEPNIIFLIALGMIGMRFIRREK